MVIALDLNDLWEGIVTELEQALYGHVEALFPICRSITGDGLRETLSYLRKFVQLEVSEVASGTQVLDWCVPPEWTVRSAAIRTLAGETIVDFAHNNLHLLQYSEPIDAILSREDLDGHLFSLPGQPDLIPYRTAYYAQTWGFCLAHRIREQLVEPAYQVVIDTALGPGSLSYGEVLLPGETQEEVLFSAHSCHPSLANDNLSAIAVALELAREVAKRPHRLSYRFLFAPGTIGAITWLHFNRNKVSRVRHGLVLTCLGDDAPPYYKRSRQGDAPIDRYSAYVLRDEGHAKRLQTFEPTGYDERQYCSPGFDLPMGRLSRSPGGTFPEYHTSADNLDFVNPAALADSMRVLLRIIEMIEHDRVWVATSQHGEPQLGRRGLYDMNGTGQRHFDQLTMLWVLNLSDGKHSLLDIAERSGKPFEDVAAAAARLRAAGLLEAY
jgi:aminopeptidase-like protein